MTRIWVGRCTSAAVVGIAAALQGLVVPAPAAAQKAAAPKASGGTHAASSPPAASTTAHHAKPITSSAPPGGAASSAPPAAAAPPGPTAASPPAAAVPAAPPSVPAPAASAPPTAVPATPPAEEPAANNWGVGILGLALLAAGIFFGLRYARQRGLTMADALKRLGVEMPQDAAAASAARLKPASPPLPPLPSLADLPAAGPASTAAGVSAAPPAVATGTPRLVGVEGPVTGEAFVLSSGPFTIGREVDNSLALTQDATVSRHHASVEEKAGAWMVTDAGSSNGTFVNGRRVAGSQPLQPGDVVQIGASRLRFEG
jgi:hypothetical protein